MNLLHTFLAAGNVQARPVLGEQFDFKSQTGADGPIGFFSAADEKSAFELGGTLDEMDRISVVARDEIDSGNEPAVNDTFSFDGVLLQIRFIKKDASSYILGLKMLDAEP